MFFRYIPVKLQRDFFQVLIYKMYHKMCSLLEHTDKVMESQIPGQMHKAKHTEMTSVPLRDTDFRKQMRQRPQTNNPSGRRIGHNKHQLFNRKSLPFRKH